MHATLAWWIAGPILGPTAAQLGGGRVLAVAVAAGALVGVKFQPRLVATLERARRRREVARVVPATEVL